MKHEIFMRRCFELAQCALGNVAPNPLVGAVLVLDEKIISEGYHQFFGGPHAEVHAINRINDDNRIAQATLYVNLEPCSHYGKTPPCTDMILSKKIKQVFISNLDPNPLVNGSGVTKLIAAGVRVKFGILAKEGLELNRRFFTFHTKKRPYFILKWARSADHYIAPASLSGTNKISWISNETSRLLVHQWRAQEPAILVGRRTVEQDNPRLTVRHWNGNNPTRIVLDTDLRINNDKHIFDKAANTWVINSKKESRKGNIEYIKVMQGTNWLPLLNAVLYERGIQSVLVEGGAETLNTFIKSNLWDEARVFTSGKSLHNGIKSPALPIPPIEEYDSAGDKLEVYRNLQAH